MFRSFATNPPADSPGLAFHAASNTTVLTVGSTGNEIATWTYNGTAWGLTFPPGSKPIGRVLHRMTSDTGRNVVMLYGGSSLANNATYNDLWEWNGTNWMVLSSTGPKSRAEPAFAYDSARQRTLLFGGFTNSGGCVGCVTDLGDTWEWTGTAWSQRAPATAPSPRRGPAMAFDAQRSRMVLFGGNGGGSDLNDTWEWDGTNWTELFPAASPPARASGTMVYDPQTQGVLLFGGQTPSSGPLADLWLWNGTGWSPIVTGTKPARRSGAGLTWDTTRNVGVLFGGSNGQWQRDTWEYTPGTAGNPGSFTTFGTGCAGSRGVPALSVAWGMVPIPGQSFIVQINNMPLTGSGWMFVGMSNTTYGSLPLPFDLGVIGMGGCFLRASADLVFPVQNVLGVGLWTITLPSFTAGMTFYNQGVVFDPGSNSLGLVVSDGATVVVSS